MCVPAINTPETRHGELRVVSKKGLVVDWKPFLTTTQEEVRRLKKIQQAVQLVGKLETQQNLYDTCNMYFTKLPRGKSLRELWKGGGVFISLWPNSPRGEFAVTHSNNKDITIASWQQRSSTKWHMLQERPAGILIWPNERSTNAAFMTSTIPGFWARSSSTRT
jgi:hypothetical protein